MKGIQYTIRGIPEELDTVLREEAAQYGKSLNSLLIDKLSESSGIAKESGKNSDFDQFVGSWVEDPGFDEAIKCFDEIDPEEWE